MQLKPSYLIVIPVGVAFMTLNELAITPSFLLEVPNDLVRSTETAPNISKTSAFLINDAPSRGNTSLNDTSRQSSIERKQTVHEIDTGNPEYNFIIHNNSNRSLPEPKRVMEQYIRWHSHEALEKFPDNRTFAIGYYSCPMQAGNRLSQFFNSLKWAIVTNRTLLWKYYDNATCRENQGADIRYANESVETGLCEATKTEDYCARFLTRASWIPSYDEWKDKLSLGEPVRLHFWSTTPKRATHPARLIDRFKGYEKEAGVDAKSHLRFVNFPIQVGPYAYLEAKRSRNYLLHTQSGQTTAVRLYDEGMSFLYGMLFRATFDFTTKLPIATSVNATSRGNSITIGLHSRHQSPAASGDSVYREMRCLSRLLFNKTMSPTRPCVVYMMSDREATLSKLSLWLAEINCTARVANHSKVSKSFLREHGPFAGGGFLDDLQMVSQARHGFIGSATSSSQMILSLIAYDRVMEAWRFGHAKTKLKQCEILAN